MKKVAFKKGSPINFRLSILKSFNFLTEILLINVV